MTVLIKQKKRVKKRSTVEVLDISVIVVFEDSSLTINVTVSVIFKRGGGVAIMNEDKNRT